MPGAFNPKKFLELGKTLIADSRYDEDARIRTSIGRCYYATFLIAWRKMVRTGVRFDDKTKIHQEVKDAYMDNGYSDIGNKLDQLREMRRRADYEMDTEIVMNECKQCAQLSEYTIQLISEIAV
jgi:virulence-associated protein VapD